MPKLTIGVDEVGRGPLFGPVVAAAVVLPEDDYLWIAEIKDSKLLSAKKREKLAEEIVLNSYVSIREASVDLINEMNILYATLYAMKLAIEDVYAIFPQDSKPELVLVDGKQIVPTCEGWLNLPIEQQAVINGDSLHKAIGAASIVAKVYRDNLMERYDEMYPQYGLKSHKGYGSLEHRTAIAKFGPTPDHRRTFKGVREFLLK
jgi:ribonuclease HII